MTDDLARVILLVGFTLVARHLDCVWLYLDANGQVDSHLNQNEGLTQYY